MGIMEDLERTREEISSLLQSRLQPIVEPIEDILNVIFVLHHFVLDCIIQGLALARRNSLIIWENKKKELCEDYFKMPGGLKPNQYHTRYYVGLSRIRVFEYGIAIQVLPNLRHVGIRCFSFCGIPIFQGDPVSVPVAPYG